MEESTAKISSVEEAKNLCEKLECLSCIQIAKENDVDVNQLRITNTDTNSLIAKKIIKCLLKQEFPSSPSPRILSTKIKVDLIDSQSKIISLVFFRNAGNNRNYETLSYYPNIRNCLSTLSAVGRANGSILRISNQSGSDSFSVNIVIPATVQNDNTVPGSKKSFILAVAASIKTFKEALNSAMRVIGDFDTALNAAMVIRTESERREAIRNAGAVAHIIADITGVQRTVEDITPLVVTDYIWNTGAVDIPEEASAPEPEVEDPEVEDPEVEGPEEEEYELELNFGTDPDDGEDEGEDDEDHDDEDHEDEDYDDEDHDDEDDEDHDDEDHDDQAHLTFETVDVPLQESIPASPEVQARLNTILREQGVNV